MHQEREFPGRVSGSDLCNPDFAMLARAYGWASAQVIETADFEPALRAALSRKGPTLLHLKLPVEVSTSRATLTAIRGAARARVNGSA
jgi:acetolactate synthase-1/2/3 large subunit